MVRDRPRRVPDTDRDLDLAGVVVASRVADVAGDEAIGFAAIGPLVGAVVVGAGAHEGGVVRDAIRDDDVRRASGAGVAGVGGEGDLLADDRLTVGCVVVSAVPPVPAAEGEVGNIRNDGDRDVTRVVRRIGIGRVARNLDVVRDRPRRVPDTDRDLDRAGVVVAGDVADVAGDEAIGFAAIGPLVSAVVEGASAHKGRSGWDAIRDDDVRRARRTFVHRVRGEGDLVADDRLIVARVMAIDRQVGNTRNDGDRDVTRVVVQKRIGRVARNLDVVRDRPRRVPDTDRDLDLAGVVVASRVADVAGDEAIGFAAIGPLVSAVVEGAGAQKGGAVRDAIRDDDRSGFVATAVPRVRGERDLLADDRLIVARVMAIERQVGFVGHDGRGEFAHVVRGIWIRCRARD